MRLLCQASSRAWASPGLSISPGGSPTGGWALEKIAVRVTARKQEVTNKRRVRSISNCQSSLMWPAFLPEYGYVAPLPQRLHRGKKSHFLSCLAGFFPLSPNYSRQE